MTGIERLEHRACFGGWQDVYRHDSATLGCAMNVAFTLKFLQQGGSGGDSDTG